MWYGFDFDFVKIPQRGILEVFILDTHTPYTHILHPFSAVTFSLKRILHGDYRVLILY